MRPKYVRLGITVSVYAALMPPAAWAASASSELAASAGTSAAARAAFLQGEHVVSFDESGRVGA
jgi:hypothetical protein